jgi:glycosyltransferase involved in cell wall biosynthesis
MRIAFNGQRLTGQRLGVGRYIEYLLRHWATMLDQNEEISVFLRRPVEEELGRMHPRIRFVLLNSSLSGIPWENLHLRAATSHHDVLFCPAYTAPVHYRGRLVVATHSLNETQPSAQSWFYRQTYARLHRHCAREANAVIVPARSIRGDLMREYGVAADRIAVVHQGADEAFRPITDLAVLRAVRERYFGADRPYILFVGKCSKRRNIPMLLEAFARLRSERGIPHGLLLFGPNHEDLPLQELCGKLGVSRDVVQTDGVVQFHTDLVPVYSAASVFVHPSENEGWSMTTVEALACGTAVIASNRGGLNEVARGHALMVTPSVDALVEAIGRVVTDDVLRTDLCRRGQERARALRWDACASQTLAVLRAVVAGNGLERTSV